MTTLWLAVILCVTPGTPPPGRAVVPVSLDWLAILRNPDRVALEHDSWRLDPVGFRTRVPAVRSIPLRSFSQVLTDDRARTLLSNLQLERWLNPLPNGTSAPCRVSESRRDAITMLVSRAADTIRVELDPARGLVTMRRTGQPRRGGSPGSEFAVLLKMLAEAFPTDPLLASMQPCDRDAVPDSGGSAVEIDVAGPMSVPQVKWRVGPKYPKKARELGIEGTVMVQVLVGSDGHVLETQIARSIPALDEAAVVAVERWQFEPARSHGKPTPVWVAMPVRFTLK